MRLALTLLATFALALVACSDDGDTEDSMEETPTVETPTVQITDILVGTGQTVQAGDTVTVHYPGTLAAGTEFDSSIGGEPIPFSLDRVIQGWQEGIPGMQPGGKRRLIIPSELGYGDAGFGDLIPPGAELTFDVELISIP